MDHPNLFLFGSDVYDACMIFYRQIYPFDYTLLNAATKMNFYSGPRSPGHVGSWSGPNRLRNILPRQWRVSNTSVKGRRENRF